MQLPLSEVREMVLKTDPVYADYVSAEDNEFLILTVGAPSKSAEIITISGNCPFSY